MEQELGELSKIVATVRLRVISADGQEADRGRRRHGRRQAAERRCAAQAGAARARHPRLHRARRGPRRSAGEEALDPRGLAGRRDVRARRARRARSPFGRTSPDAVVQIDGDDVAAARGRSASGGQASASRSRRRATRRPTPTWWCLRAQRSSIRSRFSHPGEMPPAYEAPLRKPPPPLEDALRRADARVRGAEPASRAGPRRAVGGLEARLHRGAFGLRGGYRLSRYFAARAPRRGRAGRARTTRSAPARREHHEGRPVADHARPASRRRAAAFASRPGMGVGVHGLSVNADIKTFDGATIRRP